MEYYRELTFWVFETKAWIIFGLVLVILDVFLGSMVLLPVGIAGFLTGALVYADQNMLFGDAIYFETWRSVMLVFAVLAIASVGIVKKVFQKSKDEQQDINEY